MLIIIIGCIIGWMLGWALASGIPMLQARRSETKAIEAAMTLELEQFDAEGHRKGYDAHYSRNLEKEQGVPVVTQCEDTSCTECYWKARMLNDIDHSVFPGGSVILRKRQDWIKEQVDGLSDDLYDLLYEDWRADMAPEITAHWDAIRKRREEKTKRKEEEYYGTPYDQIQLYKAQGRTYNRSANAWSNPKESSQATDTARSVIARNRLYWRQKHPDYAPINPKPVGNLTVGPLDIDSADTVVDMDVSDIYDMESNCINRIMTTTFASGKRVVHQEKMTHEGWKNARRNK